MTAPVDYPVVVNSGIQQAASLTAVSAATATTVLTTNHMARELLISNTLNADYWLTLGGLAWIALPSGSGGGTTPFRVVIPAGTVLGAYAMSGTATSGFLALTAN